jgi:hypothetical protein
MKEFDSMHGRWVLKMDEGVGKKNSDGGSWARVLLL